MDTLTLLPIAAVVIYFYFISFVGRWCRDKNVSSIKAFSIGFFFAVVFLCGVLFAGFIYQGKLILFNDSGVLTVALVVVFSALGGSRCAGFIK